MLIVLNQDYHEILPNKKSSQWKFWIADVPKRNTTATNLRITDKLNMGAPQSVSMQTNRFRQHNQDRDASYLEMTPFHTNKFVVFRAGKLLLKTLPKKEIY